MAEVSDTHGAIYNLMETIEERLDPDNSAYIDLGFSSDNLHHDELTVEADALGIAALPRIRVNASMMGEPRRCRMCYLQS